MVTILIKILLASWFITSFRPLHDTIEFFKSLIKNNFVYIIVDTLHEMITCLKCCNFWVGLILFQDIWLALIASFIANLYTQNIPWIEKIIIDKIYGD